MDPFVTPQRGFMGGCTLEAPDCREYLGKAQKRPLCPPRGVSPNKRPVGRQSGEMSWHKT
eukprot:11186783-Prorocentrum_lima.AAC.1